MEESGPLVSIVTPTLNQGRWIEHTIRSIREQGFESIEHIVVDGGSTDDTLDILRRHEGTYPLRWISEPDEGMYDAINKGMGMAEGEILTYTNSDDALFPWAVEAAVEALEAHPEADVVFGDALRIDEASGCQRLLLVSPLHRPTVAAIGSLVQPAVFFRRRLVEQQGPFDPSLRYVGDLEYWLRAMGDHEFIRVEEVLAAERWHEGAFSQASAEMMAIEGARMREPYLPASPTQRRLRHTEARIRDALMRRAQLLRFALATRRTSESGSWRRFRAADLTIHPGQLVLGLVPGIGPRALNGAIESGEGARLLGISRRCSSNSVEVDAG